MASWDKITVQQFQDIHRLSITADIDTDTKVERVVSIVYDKTEREVEEMLLKDFNKAAKECSFLLTDQIPGKPVREIKTNGRRYAIEYNPRKLKYRQYIEVLTYASKPIENLHLIMASIVNPVRWGIKRKNEAKDHEKIAADMQEAKMTDVYNSCVFFCKLYTNSIRVIQPSLVEEMMKTKKISQSEAETIVAASIEFMAGLSQQKSSPTL